MVDIASAHAPSARRSTARRAPAGTAPHASPGAGAKRPPEGRATIEDWLRIPEEKRAELIHGRIVYHAFPGVKHGDTQAQISHFLRPYRGRRPGGEGGGGAALPGGWWLSQEVDMQIGDIGCRPDVVGWRRDRHARVPEADERGVVTAVPDFLCEVLSASTVRYDQGEKRDAYFRAGVPHYWMVDPTNQTLTVLEWTERGYVILRVAGPGETVRAAPFEAVEIPVEDLFLDEEGDLPTAEPPPPEPAPAPSPVKATRKTSTPASSPKKQSPRRAR